MLFVGIKQLNPRYVLPFVVLMGIACALVTLLFVFMVFGSLFMSVQIIDYIVSWFLSLCCSLSLSQKTKTFRRLPVLSLETKAVEMFPVRFPFFQS